jgi:hypothetical protein
MTRDCPDSLAGVNDIRGELLPRLAFFILWTRADQPRHPLNGFQRRGALSMLLGGFYDGLEIHREEKIVYARFLVPHRVISTCMAAGGLRDDLTHL